MKNILFSDEVFSSTDLNRRAADVLNQAHKSPVTIARNGECFALMRREQAAAMAKSGVQMMEITQIALASLDHPAASPAAWVKALDEHDRRAMLGDVLAASANAFEDDDWDRVGDVIHQWKESAAVLESGVLRDSMREASGEQPLTDPNDVLPA